MTECVERSAQPKLPDSHIHSRHSFDCKERVSAQCRAAIKAGLGHITITDHCEIIENGQSPLWSMKSMRASQRDARAARARFAGRLEVLSGVELGQPAYQPEVARQVLAQGRYDFVLASVHYLRDGRDFYELDYRECDPDEVYDKYLTEVLETVRFGDFDALAHMNYPMRYILRDGVPFDEKAYYDRYEEILRELAAAGKALEINTKGRLKPDGVFIPSLEIVRMFREVGGRYITLGSDAHRATQLGVGISEGMKLALEAGFGSLYYYKDRKPVEIRIEQ